MRAALSSLLSQLSNQTKPDKNRKQIKFDITDKNKTAARLPLPFTLAPKMMFVEANQVDKLLKMTQRSLTAVGLLQKLNQVIFFSIFLCFMETKVRLATCSIEVSNSGMAPSKAAHLKRCLQLL